MKLIWPSMEYDKSIQAYRQEFLDSGDSRDGGGSLRKFNRTQDWLDRVETNKRDQTQYIYIRETDGKMVGIIQIRHCLKLPPARDEKDTRRKCSNLSCRSAQSSASAECLLPACREMREARERS